MNCYMLILLYRITCVMNLKREGMKVSEAKNLQKVFLSKEINDCQAEDDLHSFEV